MGAFNFPGMVPIQDIRAIFAGIRRELRVFKYQVRCARPTLARALHPFFWRGSAFCRHDFYLTENHRIRCRRCGFYPCQANSRTNGNAKN